MTVAIEVVVAIVVAGLLAAGLLRWRKIRRDERRLSDTGTLIGPPPSPYQTAKGFRLLDGETPPPHHEPAPLRLESSREYVFGETTPIEEEEVSIDPHRHDVQWALDRSAHRSPLMYRRRLVVALVVAVVVIVGAFLLAHHPWSSAPAKSGEPAARTERPVAAPRVTDGPRSFAATYTVTGHRSPRVVTVTRSH
ncbi:MAG: hypothetical protein ACYDEH_00190 [Acidimicrobiales bacterium]